MGRATVRIDALSGQVLEVFEGAEAMVPMGHAYVNNPALDASPIEVELPLATEGLADARLEMLQCRDRGEVSTFGLRVCTEEPAAGPDLGGNYLPEAVPYPANPGIDEDEFAAVHTYWNSHRGFAWFEALGWEPAEGLDAYTEIVVNQRGTDLWTESSATEPSAPLAPYNNAYFTGMYEDWEGEWVNARMVFGQGTDVDYAYDSDVIMHELGHLIYRSQNGPTRPAFSDFGPTIRDRALNEGLADYWSSAIQGDAALAEYAAGADDDRTALRHLDGDLTCTSDLVGESHYDGLIFGQAVWTARQTLDPGTATAFDRAVLDSLSLFPSPITFGDAATTLVIEVSTAVSSDAGAALHDELDRRGLFACDPVVPVTPGPAPFRDFHLIDPSSVYSTLGPMPGPLQFKVEVPEGGAMYALRFDQGEFLGFDPYDNQTKYPLELVARADGPLTWVREWVDVEIELYDQLYSFTVAEWTHDGTWLAEAVEVGVGTFASTDQYARISYEALFALPPGTWHLQFINPHPGSGVVQNLVLDTLTPPDHPAPYLVQTSRSAPEARSGCACAVGGAGPGWAWAWAVVAVPWGLRRRSAYR